MTDSPLRAEELEAMRGVFEEGVDRAAAALTRLVHQRVRMSVPHCSVSSDRELITQLGTDPVRVVEQQLSGPFTGKCSIIFTHDGHLDVAQAMISGNLPDDMLVELQEEALCELGNIVINACVSSASRRIDRPIHVGVPSFRVVAPETMFVAPEPGTATFILLRVDLALEARHSDGHLTLLVEIQGLDELRTIITQLAAPAESP